MVRSVVFQPRRGDDPDADGGVREVVPEENIVVLGVVVPAPCRAIWANKLLLRRPVGLVGADGIDRDGVLDAGDVAQEDSSWPT